MPMMHVLLLLITQTTPADHVLDRYVSLRKSLSRMEVAFTVTAGQAPVSFESVIDGKKRLFVAAKASGLDYVASITPKQVLELDRLEKTYDEHRGEKEIYLPNSRLTGAFGLFPTWLYSSDLRQLLPKNTPFVLGSAETVGSQKCDHVVGKFKTAEETGTLDAAIDSAGIVRRIRVTRVSPRGASDVEWRFTAMKPFSPAGEKKFDLRTPLGYIPYALPDAGNPISVGEVFPLSGWSSSSGKLDITAKLGAQGGLIAIFGKGSDPSRAAKQAVMHLSKDLPTVNLTDAKAPSEAGVGFDPTGRLMQTVNPPATPFFALVDGTGKIRRLWMGFDAQKASEFEADVRKSFAEKD